MKFILIVLTAVSLFTSCGGKETESTHVKTEEGLIKDDSAARNVNTTGGEPDVTEVNDDPLKK